MAVEESPGHSQIVRSILKPPECYSLKLFFFFNFRKLLMFGVLCVSRLNVAYFAQEGSNSRQKSGIGRKMSLEDAMMSDVVSMHCSVILLDACLNSTYKGDLLTCPPY